MKELDKLDKLFSTDKSAPNRDEIKSRLNEEEQETYAFLKDMEFSLGNLKAKEKLSYLKKIEADIVSNNSQKTRIISIKRITSVAASIIVLIGASWLFFRGNYSNDIYDKYYSFYPSLDIERSADVFDQNENLYDGLILYNQKDFDRAVKQLQSVNDDKARFFQGLSLMELGNWENSILEFDKMREPNLYPTYYYKSLSLIQLDRKKEALKELKKFKYSSEYFNQKIKSLLVDLEI